MKKKLAIALVAVTTVATLFTGCGKKDISGNYVAKIGFTDMLDEDERAEMDEMAEYGLDFTNLEVKVNLELTEDGEYTLSFDGESFKNDITAAVNDGMDDLVDAALAESGLTRDDITDEAAQLYGYDSADALFAAFADEMNTQLESGMEDLEKEVEDSTVTGTYKVSKDKVVFVTEEGNDVTFDEGTLNDDDSITVEAEDDNGQTWTFEFEKQ